MPVLLRRLALLASFSALCLAVLGGGGFVWFLRNAHRATPPPPVADGIVVLTGGAERIDAGLRLLAAGRGQKLLISGVSGGLNLPDLERRLGISPTTLRGRVTLGHQATSTWGNGAETAVWVRTNQLHSLIVVTAAYHMPRALTEMGRALPGIALYPAAVLPPPRPGTNDSDTLRMMAGEYAKWLGAQLGLGYLSRGHS